METARYDAAGGPIRIEIASGFAQPGAYQLFIWEANRNSNSQLGQGNFISSEDDVFQLSASPAQNGRILQCIATVNPVGDGGRFAVTMDVEQDGRRLASDTVAGQAPLPTVTLQVFIQLEEV